MRNTDIRLGNLFIEEHSGEIIKVESISEDSIGFSGKFQSTWQAKEIPITEEWLIRFGFEETYKSEYRIRYDLSNNFKFGFDINKKSTSYPYGFRFIGSHVKNIKTVHQLQNIYFDLTGEELTTIK